MKKKAKSITNEVPEWFDKWYEIQNEYHLSGYDIGRNIAWEAYQEGIKLGTRKAHAEEVERGEKFRQEIVKAHQEWTAGSKSEPNIGD